MTKAVLGDVDLAVDKISFFRRLRAAEQLLSELDSPASPSVQSLACPARLSFGQLAFLAT